MATTALKMDAALEAIRVDVDNSIEKINQTIAEITKTREEMVERHAAEMAELSEKHAEELATINAPASLTAINELRSSAISAAKFLSDQGAGDIEIPSIPTFAKSRNRTARKSSIATTEAITSVLSVDNTGMSAKAITEAVASATGESVEDISNSVQSSLAYGKEKGRFIASKPDGYHNVWTLATDDSTDAIETE